MQICSKILYKSLVQPHIEYAAAVWLPRYISDIQILEGVQCISTRQLPTIKSLSYEERLEIDFTTLRFMGLRVDVIEVYKMLSVIYDTSITKMFYMVQDSKTRGNCLKINKQQARTNLKQNTFTLRVVNAWNSPPPQMMW